LSEIPNWQIIERDGERRLQRVYKFPDFAEAVRFTQSGRSGEEAGITPRYSPNGDRDGDLVTHKIRGLHRNDFIMAAKTDDA